MNTSEAPLLTDAELKLLQALVYQECGMYFDERRTHFLQDRLQRRLKECQLDSFYGYYRLLISQQGKAELAQASREPDRQRDQFLPQQGAAGPVPAGNAGGHSASQARASRLHPAHLERGLLHRAGTLHAGHAGRRCAGLLLVAQSVAVLTCHSQAADTAARGGWRFWPATSAIPFCARRRKASTTSTRCRPVDYGYRLRYFDKVGDRYAVKKAVKELVHFDFHNLKTEYLPQRNDVIFCRNVMMYFDEAEQKRLVEKFYRCLNPQGYLFVGHAESLLGLTDKFQMVHHNSGTAYQRVEVTG